MGCATFGAMAVIVMTVVVLHLVLGFGWPVYKLEFEKKKKK